MANTHLAAVSAPLREQPRGRPALDQLLSLGTAAELLGISVHTLRKYVARGEIPRVKLRRRVLIDPVDLKAFIQAHKETRGRFPGG